MKLFKTTDKKLEAIGFIKTRDSQYEVIYHRYNEVRQFQQMLHLVHRRNGQHLIFSYQASVNPTDFRNVVGLTRYEAALASRKMKEKKWSSKVQLGSAGFVEVGDDIVSGFKRALGIQSPSLYGMGFREIRLTREQRREEAAINFWYNLIKKK